MHSCLSAGGRKGNFVERLQGVAEPAGNGPQKSCAFPAMFEQVVMCIQKLVGVEQIENKLLC